MSALSWAVVATEDEPERAAWSRAAQEVGVAQPRFVPWSAVVNPNLDAGFLPAEVVFAERLHPRVAGNPVGGQRARHTELRAALEQLEATAAKAGARLAAAVEPTLLALDRTTRDESLRSSGLPVLEPSDPSAPGRNILRPRFAGSDDWLVDGSHTRLFKHRTRTGFEVWRAPGEADEAYDGLAELVALLADDGVHAVAGLYRVRLNDDFYDIRFSVVDGKVTHAAGVIREQPLAREWYGGKRSEFDAFLQRFGAERWERVVALAERAAAHFPGIRSLGVDLAMDNESEYVFDVDPFGAYLPGLADSLPNTVREPISVRATVLRSLSAYS